MKTQEPRYDEFKFTGNDISSIDEVLAERDVVYAPTGAGGDDFDQFLRVTRSLPNGEETDASPLVRFPAFTDDSARPEDGLFNRFVANETGRPVYSVSAPGVDFSQWRQPEFDTAHLLTPDQIAELKDGSYAKVGEATMRAVRNADAHWNGGPRAHESYLLHASSMGVAIAAGAIRAAMKSGLPLDGIVLAEGVNFVDRPLLTLGQQFAGQNKYADGYLKQNPASLYENGEPMGNWVKRTFEARKANVRYAKALARGAFMRDIGDISGLSAGEQAVPILMTRGTISQLSDREGYETVRTMFEQSGVIPEDIPFDGHDHPYTMTVQSVIDAAKKIS